MKTIIVQGRECDTMILTRTGLLISLLILLTMLIVPVSAFSNYQSNLTQFYFSQSFPKTSAVYTLSQADAICKDMGYTGYDGANYRAWAFNNVGGTVSESDVAFGNSWAIPGGATYWSELKSPCTGGTVSHPATGYVYFSYSASAYPLTLSTSIAGSTVTATLTDPIYYNGADTYWDFGDGTPVLFYPANHAVSVQTHTYNSSGTYAIVISSPLQPSTTRTVSKTVTIGTIPSEAIVYLRVMDGANPGAYVADASVGIRNTTSGVWRNSTSPSGYSYFDSTGAAFEYKLSTNQSITLSAGGNGFETVAETFTIPYSGYEKIFVLPRTGTIPTTGGTTYNVMVVSNSDGQPVNSAVVRLLTGVNGPCAVGDGCLQYTNQYGITVFSNISSSTTASLTAFAQAYAQQVKIVNSNPNGSVNVNFSLTRTGQIPVTTPVRTPTGAVAPTATTASPYPVLTDASGNVITAPDQKGFAAFGLLIDYAYTIMSVAIFVVLIWLLWMIVYIITGGAIIKKMMNRRR